MMNCPHQEPPTGLEMLVFVPDAKVVPPNQGSSGISNNTRDSIQSRGRPLWSEELNEEELITDDEFEDRMIEPEWRAVYERRAAKQNPAAAREQPYGGSAMIPEPPPALAKTALFAAHRAGGVDQEKIPTEPVASLPVRATAAPPGQAKYLHGGPCVFEWIGQPPNVGLCRSDVHHQEEILPLEEPQKRPIRSPEKNLTPKKLATRYLSSPLPQTSVVLPEMAGAMAAATIGVTATQAVISPPLPADMKEELYSIGTRRHEAGKCRVCIFFLKGACKSGPRCQYCHAPHTKVHRPDKKTRELSKVKDLKRRLEGIDGKLCSLFPAADNDVEQQHPKIAQQQLAQLKESKRLLSNELDQRKKTYSEHKASMRANRKKVLAGVLLEPQNARLYDSGDSEYNSGYSTSTTRVARSTSPSTTAGRSSGSSTYDELGPPRASLRAALGQVSNAYGLSFDSLQHQK